mgnify:CR=1 FL=1
MTYPHTPFPATTFATLAATEATHWSFRVRNQVWLWVLKEQVRHFDSFLEIGCDPGFVPDGIHK